jgi:hypothetical protein
MAWRLVVIALLLCATPWSQVCLAPGLLGYTSYDTTPWAEAVPGAFLVLAGLTTLPAIAWRESPNAVRAAQPLTITPESEPASG